ncbi:hypothetical protein ACSYAD_32370 [Acaryochloris marina NIES-2412]|uniref:hypothetical protein n=1 Tax=Acaryochloris marina TaxID=155978 RepID=UPI004057E29A
MSEPNSWKYLTVREFLEGYNWSGEPIPQTDSIHNSEVGECTNWQRQAVQTFFSQFNWTGRPVERTTIVATTLSFSTRLRVQEFFQCFTWEGQPNIAAMPSIAQPSPITVEDDLNLNDLSDIF